jgi:hypothetical protein
MHFAVFWADVAKQTLVSDGVAPRRYQRPQSLDLAFEKRDRDPNLPRQHLQARVPFEDRLSLSVSPAADAIGGPNELRV